MTKDDAIKAIEGKRVPEADGFPDRDMSQSYNLALDHAIEAIRALPDAGWRDISEAPEEQVPLLLWARRAGDPTFQVVCGWRYGRQWAIYGTARSQVCLDIVDPLFFMPLPTPPEKA